MAHFRLDETRSKVLSAAGFPNASRADEAIEGAEGPTVTYQGTIQVDDLTHLSPYSFSPQYVIGGNQSGVAAQFSTVEIVSPVPWLLKRIEPTAATHEVAVRDVPLVFQTIATPKIFHPAETLTPRQATVLNGATATNVTGFFVESNRALDMDIMVPPGVYVVVQTSSNNTSGFPNIVVQEFIGGVTRPT